MKILNFKKWEKRKTLQIAMDKIQALIYLVQFVAFISIEYFFLFVLFMQAHKNVKIWYGMANISKQVCILDTVKIISVKQDAECCGIHLILENDMTRPKISCFPTIVDLD